MSAKMPLDMAADADRAGGLLSFQRNNWDLDMLTPRRVALTLSLLLIVDAAHAQNPALAESLAKLRQVGSAGQGHAEARRAWGIVAKSSPADLPTLLRGIDNDQPLGANWVRAAVDQIAERAVEQGRELPRQELEKLIFDQSVSPRARRLGFEWLTRVDAAAADRIIPQMLDDSSVEMRRDAVQAVLDRAARLEAEGDVKQASEQFRVALSAARDTDQVEKAYDSLAKLGVEIDLQRHFGFVAAWRVIGPFDNTNKGGFDVAYPPEQALDAGAVYVGKKGQVKWIEYETADKYGMVDLNAALGKDMGAVGYAWATFESPREQTVDLRLGCINASKLWLNGTLLSASETYHSGTKIDQYVVRGELHEGPNEILVKVCQNEQTDAWAQDWQFQFRVCDRVGTAILELGR